MESYLAKQIDALTAWLQEVMKHPGLPTRRQQQGGPEAVYRKRDGQHE